MILKTAVRWCFHCGRLQPHVVAQQVRRGQPVDVRQTCEVCKKDREIPGPSVSRNNGGMGDQKYAKRRAAKE
jgi:hypothetical protein